MGFEPALLMLWNTCAIGCAKKTAENAFKRVRKVAPNVQQVIHTLNE